MVCEMFFRAKNTYDKPRVTNDCKVLDNVIPKLCQFFPYRYRLIILISSYVYFLQCKMFNNEIPKLSHLYSQKQFTRYSWEILTSLF